jgi:hypothetical protein
MTHLHHSLAQRAWKRYQRSCSVGQNRFRGLTRASKPSARKLADQGVEIFGVSLTVGNESEVRKAFEGANIIFVSLSRYLYYFGQTSHLDFKVVTNYWKHMNMQRVSLISDVASFFKSGDRRGGNDGQYRKGGWR